ncbi:DUF2839 domain-containing protein [filamentous cyanobacterium LEGE 11480]|uniref:DUF2839 domain-containing protein n=1 Tax=Romeriopsis navalis LEGE 11480 TaxID=2777977 RepID=A0A928VLF7_9CYAN|nr:DUF2839 domain-containing protein [Romeriopsis navalis]MBE9028781.1 DUF2839 domain-containing protein [Romeriopsis navalis LEGE 11480]
MGEAKRRKELLGEKYGQDERFVAWLPITKKQSTQFVETTTKGAWLGIGSMVLLWITIRFIGPFFGWWELAG